MKIKIDAQTKRRLKRLGVMILMDLSDGEMDEPEEVLDLMHVLTSTIEQAFEAERERKSTTVLD